MSSVPEAPRAARRAPPGAGVKLRGAEKMARIPIKIEAPSEPLRKPPWIRAKLGDAAEVARVKAILRAHARPLPLDPEEPAQLARTIRDLGLRYVVITSVDRDDLRDGGAAHFAACIRQARALNPQLVIEVLVPDFRGRMDPALAIFKDTPPDVFNHNLETVPRLYKQARPGSDYEWSLDLLERFKALHPEVPTKSGLMLGLGEALEEIEQVMRDLRAHRVDMLTLGQYLQPSRHHLPVARYVHPDEFERLREYGMRLGFSHVASGPLVRSSYHADRQAERVLHGG